MQVYSNQKHYLLLFNSNLKDKSVVFMKYRSCLECAPVQQLLLPTQPLAKQ